MQWFVDGYIKHKEYTDFKWFVTGCINFLILDVYTFAHHCDHIEIGYLLTKACHTTIPPFFKGNRIPSRKKKVCASTNFSQLGSWVVAIVGGHDHYNNLFVAGQYPRRLDC